MRRPYEVFKKHQYLLKIEAKREVAARMSCEPKNCRYNKKVVTERGHIVQVCTFDRETTPLVVCDTLLCATQCSAYAPLYLTDKDAVNAWVQEISDPKVKMQRYPAISALEWVMDNHLHEIKGHPVVWYQKVVFTMIIWLEKIISRTSRSKQKSPEDATGT